MGGEVHLVVCCRFSDAWKFATPVVPDSLLHGVLLLLYLPCFDSRHCGCGWRWLLPGFYPADGVSSGVLQRPGSLHGRVTNVTVKGSGPEWESPGGAAAAAMASAPPRRQPYLCFVLCFVLCVFWCFVWYFVWVCFRAISREAWLYMINGKHVQGKERVH